MSAASAVMCGVELGEPISSSGFATNVRLAKGSSPASATTFIA
jgi:hypothetical protein